MADTQFTISCVFVADACAFVTSLCPVRLARHGGRVWGETWCPGLVSVCTTAWEEIVSGKGTDGTLVVAGNAFVVSAMCLICLIWGRSRYEMTGFLWDTPVPLRGYAGGRVAGPQQLGRSNGGIPARDFGQPLLAALLRVFLLIAFSEPYVESRGARATASTG